MADKNKAPIIALCADVTIIAGEGEGDKKSPAKFSTTFYTGGQLNIAGYDLPVVVDLAGLGRGNVLVANLDHDKRQRVGNFDVVNDGSSLVASGVASAATPYRDEVVRSALDGYQWQSSLEVAPHKIETVKAGEAVQVNGQSFKGPIYVTRKGTLKGFAFVSHGADDNTSVTIAAGAASTQEIAMNEECKKWIEAMGLVVDDLSDEQKKNLAVDFEGRPGKRAPAKDKIAGGDSLSRERAELIRQDKIEVLTAKFLDGVHREFKTIEFINGIDTLKKQAVADNWEPDRYDTELLRATIPLSRTVSAPSNGRGNYSNDVLTAAICQAGGLKNIDKEFTDQTLQTAKDRFKEGIGLKQLLCIGAHANGHHVDGFNVNLDVQRAAFGQSGGTYPMQRAAGFSTLSIPGVLSNSANKFLLEGWGAGEMTWEAISDPVNVRDFKQITQYKLSGRLKYEKVGPAGEIKYGTVEEGTYTAQADTYGKMFAVTRQDIINDDLGALTQVPRELGYGANEALNEVFWTIFLANGGGTFFAAGNNNVSTGVFSLTALAAAEAVFFAQTKPNGQPLGMLPTIILAPNGTYRSALAAVQSSFVVGSTGPTPEQNTFQGNYNVVRSAYLSNAAFTGFSAVKWYLLINRPGFAVIQVAFLNGQRAPIVETATADFGTLGMQMRGVHDFGIQGLMEPRAGVQGSGA